MANLLDATVFLDDSPKLEPASDRLGHAQFASRLATALASIAAPDGYVIGLHGPWGSGKSSVLNFVCGDLAGRNGDDAPTVVRFEPWIVSGHQDLTAAFMKVLAEAMPGRPGPFWKRWGKKALRLARTGGDDVIDAVARIGVIADQTGGIASGAAGGLAKRAIGVAADRWLKDPSLQESYTTLVKRLREHQRRYVVVVDDIDRLAADEIRDLMRMVKTLGKLPRVVYLLSYDRTIVWQALSTIDPDPRAGGFAEKIVQQEIELPMPSRSALLAMLSEALTFLGLEDADAERRAELVNTGIVRWVRQPRDVVRLANGLRFAWSALQGELDRNDLICMEGLRLYDRELFEWIRDNREALIHLSMPLDEEEQAQIAKAFGERFATTRSKAVDLMCLLFPNRQNLFRTDRYGFSGESWPSVMERRGIATAAGYEAYFSLHPAAAYIPKSMVDKAIRLSSDQEQLETILREAVRRSDEAGNSLVGSFLEELRSRIDRGASATRALLATLLRLGNEIIDAPWEGDFFGPMTQWHFLITDMFKQWGAKTSYENLKAAYIGAPLASLANLHLDLVRSAGLLPQEGVERRDYVTPEHLEELSEIVLAKIDEERQAGTLDEQPAYYPIARLWALWRGFEESRAWLSRVGMSDASRLARVATGILGYSRSRAGRNYGIYSKPDLELFDIKALREACEIHRGAPNLTDDERRRIEALTRGLSEIDSANSGEKRPGGIDDEESMTSYQ